MQKIIYSKSSKPILMQRTHIFPDLFELADSKEQLKKVHSIKEQDSFIEILNKLFKFYCRTFSYTFDYQPIQDCLQSIWDNEYNLLIPIQPLIDFLTQTNHAQAFIECIVTARSQAIKNAIEVLYDTKEKYFACTEEAQKRFNFMANIAEILDKKLYLIINYEARSCFLKGVFSDLTTQLGNISYILFFQTFITHHRELVLYGHESIQTKTRFFKKLSYYLETHRSAFTQECVFTFFQNATYWNLSCAKYYYALGQDALADSYMGTWNHVCAKDIFMPATVDSDAAFQELKRLSKESDKINCVLKQNPKIKIYALLAKSILYTGDINIHHTFSINLEPISVLNELKKYTQVSYASLIPIQEAIAALGLAYQNTYNNNLTQINTCKQIIAKLSSIFNKDPSNVMASYMKTTLCLHTKKMQALEECVQQNILDHELKTKLIQAQNKIAELETKRATLTKSTQRDNSNEGSEILQNQEEKIKKLKNQIKAIITENALFIASPTEEEHSLLKALKDENTALRKKYFILKQQSEQTQNKVNEHAQTEIILKSKIETLKRKKESLETEIRMLHELPTEIAKLKRKKEAILQKKKLRNLQKKIKQLQLKQTPLVHTKTQIESFIDTAHQTTLAVNAANHADNQEFEKSLSGFIKILSMFKSLESVPESKIEVAPIVCYNSANPTISRTALHSPQYRPIQTPSRKQKIK